MAGHSEPTLDRRTLLAGLAGAGTAGLAGCSALTDRGADAETTDTDPDLANELATRFAPTMYFDEAEPWFPTDPRPYVTEPEGDPIVDGFDAMNGYHERLTDAEEPPNRTVFYNVVEYEGSPLAVVQFWMYAAFDQFTANFHWHDWEVLHVFVDTETGEPQLYVASSHSTRVPNNEFLDPEPDPAPRILSELGSHSSALSVNDQPDDFQRLPGADLLADITNTAIEGIESLAEIPLAYGLPRDEGGRLPYVVPEYEGEPVYDHERLSAVDADSLIGGGFTVREFEDLSTPPTDLPERSTGVVFRHEDRDAIGGDDPVGTEYAYELVPTSELEAITDFSGPQLSFEFAVPEVAEDAISGHISTAGVPWEQPRYDNPADDITDPNHRAALAERYDAIGAAAPINTVVASVGEAVTADDAPEGEGLTTQGSAVESVALLESESRVVPTFRGVAIAREVPEGDHRLTVNAAGRAPYSEQLSVGASDGTTATTGAPTTDTGTDTRTATVTPGSETTDATGSADDEQRAERVTAAGVDAEIPLVAQENAQKLEVDADGTDADLAGVAVEDDFAGRLYDAPTEGSDAVYVHRGGAYTTEVRDTDGAVGAFRVNPGRGRVLESDSDDDSDGDDGEENERGPPIRIDRPETGKASLSSFVVAVAEETRDEAQAILDEGDLDGRANGLRGLVRSLDAVIEAAERATERARASDRGTADQQLQAVAMGIDRVVDRLDDIDEGVPESFLNAVRNRSAQVERRAEQAQRAQKL